MKQLLIRTLSLSVILSAFIFSILFGLIGWIYSQFPSDATIKGCLTTKLYSVRLCPQEKNYTRLSHISEFIQKAVILTEDSAFYSHKGFDFQEMENSFKTNLEKGKFVRGGSTITQQLVKNLFLTKDKTIQRKILEALITLRVEKVLTKREILEKYLNVVQFGKDLFGVRAACQFYFKKEPQNVSVVEAAFLAFLLPGPESYSKSYFKGKLTPFAKKRLTQIIERLHQYQRINEDQYMTAQIELDHFLDGDSKESPLDFNSIFEENVELENLTE